MSYKNSFTNNRAICTFNGDLKELEIRYAFLDLIESKDIKKLKSIIFDFTNINSYILPEDHINTIKNYTRFSVSWNKNINAIAVGTNENIRKGLADILTHKKELVWNYMLFDNLNDALKWCNKNDSVK